MIFFLSAGLIALVMGGMAIGAIFQNRCLRGSCGGPEVLDPNGDPLNCSACPNRRKLGDTDTREPELISSQKAP